MTHSESGGRHIAEKVLNVLYPPTCPACGDVTGDSELGILCESCRGEYGKALVRTCPVCGRSPEECICVTVFGEGAELYGVTVDRLCFHGYYTGFDGDSVISQLLYSMKRRWTKDARVFFANLLADRVLSPLIRSGQNYIVTYIPRSAEAVRRYGFDQMEEIASLAADRLGIKASPLFKRHGGTEQKSLTAGERFENAADTIGTVRDISIRGKSVILLDDVVTTGATVSAAIKLLIKERPHRIMPVSIFLAKTMGRDVMPEDSRE